MSFRLILLASSAAVLALAACGAPEPAESPQAPAANAPRPLLTAAQIEAGVPQAAATPPAPLSDATGTQPPAYAPDPGLVRLQILLDRSPFSPGVIDGLAGENTRQAIAAWRKANNLGEGDSADAALLQRLAATDASPVMTIYTLTAADLAGPFSPPPGEDLAAQAAAGTHYSSARERLAERFHVTEALLQGLNPGVDFRRAGQTLVVPAIADRPLGEVARIVVDKTERSARAFDASGRLLAFYPATIGSTERPAPSGNLRVLGVAPEPDYTYDPAKLSYGPGDRKFVIPAGPNNPVGSVWIDLSRDSYGIHGTPDPSKIAKTASHGCVRLTNWDAEQLAASVKPGVEVRFI
ncbi:lipoprotein-anchoring transpeptidase ErfK/SrfK [Brevundimonas alba]|uniref:Lipoprotein-anchoring transpeptidase ErfK/SrfK n=1 Tax=Brevundimonas alba TaxID=74314 RepID=A0A7X5YQ28_9CAUL|nr:L,D-transpeptidase family protein [Brevundimonas alba]NJC42759.1 lipoprotein-anchoring transpeptidase ErfK/SrfK [Brevundimonas alba]